MHNNFVLNPPIIGAFSPGSVTLVCRAEHFRYFWIFSMIKNDFLHFSSSSFDWEWAFWIGLMQKWIINYKKKYAIIFYHWKKSKIPKVPSALAVVFFGFFYLFQRHPGPPRRLDDLPGQVPGGVLGPAGVVAHGVHQVEVAVGAHLLQQGLLEAKGGLGPIRN